MNKGKWPIWLALVVVVFVLPPAARARKILVVPETQHPTLTLSTDQSLSYEVRNNKSMKLKLVGPGSLRVTLRLNQKDQRATSKGRVEILRGKSKAKGLNLSLSRSRVGAYQEKKNLYPSLPKVISLSVPEGAQYFTVNFKGAKGTSLSVQLEYETEADQGAVQGAEDPLALMALVPAKGPDTAPAPDLTPEPVVPPLVPVHEPGPVAAAAVATSPQAPVVPEVTTPRTAVFPLIPKASKEPGSAVGPKPGPGPRVHHEAPPPLDPKAPTVAAERAPSKGWDLGGEHVLSLGVKGGQVSATHLAVGGTSWIVSFDLRFVFDAWNEGLELGFEAGYYRFSGTVQGHREMSHAVIPLSLQLYARLPVDFFLKPFFGCGADLYLNVAGQGTDLNTGETLAPSSLALSYGGHVSLGLESRLGPGYLGIEVRAGMSFGDTLFFSSNTASLGGIATVAGYRFLL